MDTASHLLFGATLAGLAHLDPVVAHKPALAQAVMAGTLIGSHAPDFDALMRIRGYAWYIRHHRGITHSIPALFLWPVLISLPLAAAFGCLGDWQHVYVWTCVAVVFHVFLDLMNTYGVQCLRPFTKKWMHLDILSIFEPFLFVLHVTGLAVWIGLGADPARLFVWTYAVTGIYLVLRAIQHAWLVDRVRRRYGEIGACHVVPSFHVLHWRYVVHSGDRFYAGRILGATIIEEDVYANAAPNEVIQSTIGIDGVRAFLDFAQRVHVTYKELQDGYEVRWSDMRFWYDRTLPFGVDVRLDSHLNVVNHSVGWRKRAWEPPFM